MRRNDAGSANLFLRCDLASLADLGVHGVTRPVYDDRHGVATTTLIREWLSGWLGPDARIVVKPFLDPSDPDTIRPVDGHDPTGPMADFVRLRDPHCVFYGMPRPSRQRDLDHIEPYLSPDDGGPPGQTHPDSLACLCRHHHRVKTHGLWRYRRLPDGGYSWRTPSDGSIDLPPPRR